MPRTILQHQNLQKWSKHVMFWAFSLPNAPFATGPCIFQHQNLQKRSKHVMFWAFSLPNVPFATGPCIFSTSELTKAVQTPHVLCIFTAECTFCHRGVHFFNIRTYKSGPNTSCFVHFHFRMCFSPQRRAIFHLSAEHLPPHPPF